MLLGRPPPDDVRRANDCAMEATDGRPVTSLGGGGDADRPDVRGAPTPAPPPPPPLRRNVNLDFSAAAGAPTLLGRWTDGGSADSDVSTERCRLAAAGLELVARRLRLRAVLAADDHRLLGSALARALMAATRCCTMERRAGSVDLPRKLGMRDGGACVFNLEALAPLAAAVPNTAATARPRFAGDGNVCPGDAYLMRDGAGARVVLVAYRRRTECTAGGVDDSATASAVSLHLASTASCCDAGGDLATAHVAPANGSRRPALGDVGWLAESVSLSKSTPLLCSTSTTLWPVLATGGWACCGGFGVPPPPPPYSNDCFNCCNTSWAVVLSNDWMTVNANAALAAGSAASRVLAAAVSAPSADVDTDGGCPARVLPGENSARRDVPLRAAGGDEAGNPGGDAAGAGAEPLRCNGDDSVAAVGVNLARIAWNSCWPGVATRTGDPVTALLTLLTLPRAAAAAAATRCSPGAVVARRW